MIDKNKAKEIIKEVEELVSSVIPQKYRALIEKILLGPAFEELKKLINDARPPVFYLVGRSEHEKSSLINALLTKK